MYKQKWDIQVNHEMADMWNFMDFCLLLKILGKTSEQNVVKNFLDSAEYEVTTTKNILCRCFQDCIKKVSSF